MRQTLLGKIVARPIRFAVCAWVIVLALIAIPAAAETATPAAFPVAPDPADCVTAPVAVETIGAMLATPSASSPASPAPFTLPDGEPADPQTAGEVASVLHQVFACTNAGDLLRVYAFFTDDFVRDFFAGTSFTADVAAFLTAPPQPLPPDQQRIIRDIGPVLLLADGRAGALIILDEPDDPRQEEPDFVILRQVGDSWLVDEIHEDPVRATPVTAP
jgi:hypothetical protein